MLFACGHLIPVMQLQIQTVSQENNQDKYWKDVLGGKCETLFRLEAESGGPLKATVLSNSGLRWVHWCHKTIMKKGV